MIRLFFIEQDIARATNKQKFPMQTNTGHWTLLFEYIFFEIYQKKHFIISPEYCNTAKHLNNDLSLLTSDCVSDKFSGNMEDALDNLNIASDFMYNCKVRNDKMQSNTVLHII